MVRARCAPSLVISFVFTTAPLAQEGRCGDGGDQEERRARDGDQPDAGDEGGLRGLDEFGRLRRGARLKVCARDSCRWAFFDSSRKPLRALVLDGRLREHRQDAPGPQHP
jgi:hypothetical protein